MELARFDSNFEQIIPQPMTIGYFDSKGVAHQYTPDGLLTHQAHLELPPILYEIKYRADFRDSWKQLVPKLRAAKSIAQERGWTFKVFTEKEIRTPYLENVKFLWPFKQREFDEAMLNYVLSVMSDLQEADPALLSAALFSSRKNQATVIPVIWHLVAKLRIGCDLNQPLTMHSKIWTKEEL